MITVDLQQDAIHFSAGSTEKKIEAISKKLPTDLTIHKVSRQSRERMSHIRYAPLHSSAGTRNKRFVSNYQSTRARFHRFSRMIITNLVTTLWSKTESANESSNFFHTLYVSDCKKNRAGFLLSYQK